MKCSLLKTHLRTEKQQNGKRVETWTSIASYKSVELARYGYVSTRPTYVAEHLPMINNYSRMRDSRPSQRYSWGLLSSAVWYRFAVWLVTNVSKQRGGLYFQGRKSNKESRTNFSTLENKITQVVWKRRVGYTSPTNKAGKTIPSQALTDSKCSRKFRLQDFKIIGTWSGKVVSPSHRPPLPPGYIPGTHLC
jgi:hypothetical protein